MYKCTQDFLSCTFLAKKSFIGYFCSLMKKFLLSHIVFIAAVLFYSSGVVCSAVTPEFIDTLRLEIRKRDMPEDIVYLPLALAEHSHDSARKGIWALSALDVIRVSGSKSESDTVDVRLDEMLSTEIALTRIAELYDYFGDWQRCIVAFADSPTVAASMDSSELAQAPIMLALQRAKGLSTNDFAEACSQFERLSFRNDVYARLRQQVWADEQAERLEALRKQQVANVDKITYTIRRGDTLGGIAVRYHVKVADLKRWNNLSSDMIREGRKLLIYK